MKRDIIAVFLTIILLHVTYIVISYNEAPLATLGSRGNSLVFERVLMLLQFVPLLLVIGVRRLSKSRMLLFLAFAICVDTLYIVGDFQTGVYAATIDYKSNLMPRMRVSAHLAAYKDLGRLVTLDYHAEYFLEFVVVHFISEVTSLSYILVYVSIIRVVSVIGWSVLFLWAGNRLSKPHINLQLWLLLLSFSMLIANSGYNFEYSFAPLLLLMSYLIFTRKPQSYELILGGLMVAFAIVLASFRETLIMAFICLLAVSVLFLARRIKPSSPLAKASQPMFLFLVLFHARVFQFSSQFYVESYVNKLLALANAIQIALRGYWTPGAEPLATVRSIGNPLDRGIGLISVVSAVSLMILLVVLSLSFLSRERNYDAFFFSIAIAYFLAMIIPVAGYFTMLIGAGTMLDFGSSTVFSRSLAPLVTLTVIPYFMRKKIRSGKRKTKLLTFLVVIGLSFSVVFAPFWLYRGEVRSSYDMIHVAGDQNEAFIMGTSVYNFILSHETQLETISISPMRELGISYFFLIYYIQPLRYQLGEDRVITTKTPSGAPLLDIYDNGLYALTFYYYYGFRSLVINQSSRMR